MPTRNQLGTDASEKMGISVIPIRKEGMAEDDNVHGVLLRLSLWEILNALLEDNDCFHEPLRPLLGQTESVFNFLNREGPRDEPVQLNSAPGNEINCLSNTCNINGLLSFVCVDHVQPIPIPLLH